MMSEDLIKKYYPTKEELERLGEYSDMECVFDDDSEIRAQDIPLSVSTDNPKSSKIVETISQIVIMGEPEDFFSYIWDNIDMLVFLSVFDESISDVIELGYKYYIARGNGASACDFGALHYSGQIFEQDYAKAKELYEIAVDLGSPQALINLGYIYEYGRVGEPDFEKAFEIYARAAALIGNFEALYKFGDMYSRGKAVKKDMKAAVSLWLKSYDVSENSLERGHSAFRLAKLMISPNADEYGLEYDPLAALNLFQQAELGFRIEIKNGASYYEKNLQKAIEGQAEARDLLDCVICE